MQAYRFEKYSQSIREINGSESYELRSANKLFLAKRLKLRDCIAHLFEEDIQPLDFVADPEAARQNINNWVEIQTKRQIQDLIPQDKITPNTELVLVRWKHANFKTLVFWDMMLCNLIDIKFSEECTALHSELMMKIKAICFFKVLTHIDHTTWCHIQ